MMGLSLIYIHIYIYIFGFAKPPTDLMFVVWLYSTTYSLIVDKHFIVIVI